MTEQIKSAIGALKLARDTRFFMPNNKDLEIAIRSLQAWEEALNKLEEERNRFNRCNLNGEVIGVVSAIEVINQKLSDIKE